MLVTVAALATTLLTQQPVDKPTLELYQERFVVRTAKEVIRVPLREVVEPPASVMFRRDDHYAVWDERGLTARSGDWSFTSRLSEFPTSSRFFDREQILETAAQVKKGIRKFDASGISGAKRLGNKAYFLVRWVDSSAKTWLEALVAVPLDVPKPKPQVVGLFEGMSLADRLIDDRLFLREEGLEAVVQSPTNWGVARFDPKLETFSFRPMGDKLQSYLSLTSSRGLFVESTSFGTTIAGEIELKEGTRKLLFQGRGVARFLDAVNPLVIVATSPPGRLLFNASTGAQVLIGASDEVRRAGRFVLTWTPPGIPKSARLLEPTRWIESAVWKGKP